MSYCEYCVGLDISNVHVTYHDTLYGFPIHDDNELFGRLILEINQAGLSWELILKKEAHFRDAFDNYNIEKIAAYDEEKLAQLLQNEKIIRNKLKIRSVIHNAQVILALQKEHGRFEEWLNFHHPKTKVEWTALFKKTFKFTGGEIVNEFLMSTGYLPGSHIDSCEVKKDIISKKPKWKEGCVF
jgi:DNA-3-methyladenine glycosylase I